MKRILVTGGSGLIGTLLCQMLVKEYFVINLDLKSSGFEHANFSETNLDLRDHSKTKDFLSKENFDQVVYLAWYYDFYNTQVKHFDDNQAALENFVAALNEKEQRIPFIFASSMAALKPMSPTDSLLSPNAQRSDAWLYPKSKVKGENYLRENLQHPCVEMVLAGVYTDFVELVPLYHQLERLKTYSIENFFFPGDPKRGLTYIHLKDVTRAFLQAIRKDFSTNQRFLIGEYRPMTYKDIHIRASRFYHGFAFPLWRIPTFLAKMGATILLLFNKRRFIRSWMIAFAQEHFHFDLSSSEKGLDWKPSLDIQSRFKLLLKNSQTPEFSRRNTRRPWAQGEMYDDLKD